MGLEKSTERQTQFFKLITHIIDNINKKKVTIAVFIDFKKAFDTVDHSILLKILSQLNLSQNLLKWFESYLSNHSQVTYMNSCTSPIAEITHCVPQGSILGPLLFNLYTNDLVSTVQST